MARFAQLARRSFSGGGTGCVVQIGNIAHALEKYLFLVWNHAWFRAPGYYPLFLN
jgi:hypothetical protein